MSDKRCWQYLDKDGNPVTNVEWRPIDAVPVLGDKNRPWYQETNHLHGKNGTKGIHYYGTLKEAQEELHKAWRGESELPFDKPEYNKLKSMTSEEWLESRGKLFRGTNELIQDQKMKTSEAKARSHSEDW